MCLIKCQAWILNSSRQIDWIWRVGFFLVKENRLTDDFSCFLSFSNLFHSLRSLAYRTPLTMRRIRRPINATAARDPPTMAAMFGPSGHSNTRSVKVENLMLFKTGTFVQKRTFWHELLTLMLLQPLCCYLCCLAPKRMKIIIKKVLMTTFEAFCHYKLLYCCIERERE